MSGPREQKKRQTKKAILNAAIHLFGTKGFEETSIDELAQHAGIGKGTVYSYFRTKREILYAFCEEELEHIRQELTRKTQEDTSLLDQLLTIYVGEFKYISKNREFGRLFLREIVFPKDEIMKKPQEIEDKFFDLLFPLYKKAQQRGELRDDIDLLFLSGHFYALYLLIISSWYSGRVTSIEEAATGMEMFFRQALQGLQPAHVVSHTPDRQP